MLGKPMEELLGKTMDELFPSDLAKSMIADDLRILHEGKQVVLNEELDGRVYTTIKFPINIEGKPRYLAGYTIDMTEKQKLLETAQRADKLDSLGVLAGGIAHDFNNLLSGLFGYIDLARMNLTQDPETREYLDKAFGVFSRAKDLTQQLLTFSKGGVPVKKTGLLGPRIKESATFALSGSKVGCDFNIAQDLFPCDFDENQMGQVIDNIVINAQQAMPTGGKITISACNIAVKDGEHPELKSGRYVKISIADTGTGIQPKLLKRIFDPFFTTKQKGNGLGLATCYSIMQKHEGCIEVESELDKGSTFFLFLPASNLDTIPMGVQKASHHKGSGTIVIMDDHDFIRDLAGQMLKAMGYTVLHAKGGQETLRIFSDALEAKTPISCAILDLTIPGGMGGKEAIMELRKNYPDLPIFASSGYSDDPVLATPHDYGFTDSIKKPYLKDELAKLLEKYLGKLNR
jgi:signal transduction histidine kinase/CheY-like chemotaxis protein